MAPILGSRGLLGAMPEYPIQISKVQAPPLRDQTLARDRLLEWLAVKIHDRAVLVIAEAGYGKTTLLADFSRRTRLRALWFRLDRGDRDWVGFIAYLVAAVRVHVPGFGTATDMLLRETASSAPPRDTVLDTFLRELGSLPSDPTALIFDDFHLVDDAPDIRHITRELLTRAPERLSFVFASRRVPPIRLARLRALGEVAELDTDDLRFDAVETARLFTETYEMRLDPGLIAELSRRTEGWAASLQLIRTALHDRDPAQTRAFIRSLSGAEGHLYDYLAEEVVGDLPAELQQFLMRTSILETIDLTLGPVAADVSAPTASKLIDEGERLGLFGRRGPHTRHQVRAHPLVREFLQARLLRSIGRSAVAEIHRRAAIAAESIDWRIASHHYLAAGDEDDARRVISSSIETILATGAYAAAEELAVALSQSDLAGPAGLIIASRMSQQRGDVQAAVDLAEQAFEEYPDSRAVLLTLLTARSFAGDVAGALEIGRVLQESPESQLTHIADVYGRIIGTSVDGSLHVAITQLEGLISSLRTRSDSHYLGVALCNLALQRLTMGDPEGSKACSEESISVLGASSAGVELVSARLARAAALAHVGDLEGARKEVATSSALAQRGQLLEVAFESGEIEAFFGDGTRAWALLDQLREPVNPDLDMGEQLFLLRGLLLVRDGDLEAAAVEARALKANEPRTTVAFEVRRQLLRCLIATVRGDPDAGARAATAERFATAQGATIWVRYARLLVAASRSDRELSDEVVWLANEDPTALSMAAEVLLNRIGGLSSDAIGLLAGEARRRPERWRSGIRRVLDTESEDDRLAAARILEQIGETEDVRRLRDVGRSIRRRDASHLGRTLARRLAPRVFVEDLGRVRLAIGNATVEGSDIRRKVLALLCLLLTKAKFSSTREEVLDSLWPELDPGSALNSLNQTVYFLRRVFESEYREDLSPGYLHQDGETIWLDQELLDSRSQRCRDLIRSMPAPPTPEGAERLAAEYRGRFALDFTYEEWASSFRDSLHASYLRVIEHAIRVDIDAGHFTRGTYLAERATEVEPDSEDLQISLVRLYRLSGAHAAATRQYGHYVHAVRELGLDPLPFTEV